jgi:hypothetical protein
MIKPLLAWIYFFFDRFDWFTVMRKRSAHTFEFRGGRRRSIIISSVCMYAPDPTRPALRASSSIELVFCFHFFIPPCIPAAQLA